MKFQAVIAALLLVAGHSCYAKPLLDSNVSMATPDNHDVFTNQDIQPESRISRYFKSRLFLGELFKLSLHWDRKLLMTQLECKEGFKIIPVNFGIIKPVVFPHGAEHPISGTWTYRYKFLRCGTAITYNSLVVAKDAGAPLALPMVPGTTLADPVEIKDILQPMLSLARNRALENTKISDSCRDTTVMDTEVTMRPHALALKDRTAVDAWEERWTIRSCEETTSLLVCFIPTIDGGTNWTAPEGCAAAKQL